MSASPASPKKRKQHACRCCATWTKGKAAYCKQCQDAQCDEYPGDCGHALIKPTYLAQQQGKLHPQQYTTNASEGLSREPATVDADGMAAILQDAADRGSTAVSKREQRLDDLQSLLADAQEAASRIGVDVSLQERAIERQIRVIERKTSRRVA